MVGYTVSQLANILGIYPGTVRRWAEFIPNCKQDNKTIRFPKEETSYFLYRRKKYVELLKARLENNQIENRYRHSAILLLDQINAFVLLDKTKDIWFFTIKELEKISIPIFGRKISRRSITELLKTKKLFGYKDPTDNRTCKRWIVPVYSVAIFIQQDKTGIKKIELENYWRKNASILEQEDSRLFEKVKNLIGKKDKNPKEKEFFASELSRLLSMPEAQINAIFFNKIERYVGNTIFHPIRVPTVSHEKVMKYLTLNPTVVGGIYTRWRDLLGTNTFAEQEYRDFITLWEYYIGYPKEGE